MKFLTKSAVFLNYEVLGARVKTYNKSVLFSFVIIYSKENTDPSHSGVFWPAVTADRAARPVGLCHCGWDASLATATDVVPDAATLGQRPPCSQCILPSAVSLGEHGRHLAARCLGRCGR